MLGDINRELAQLEADMALKIEGDNRRLWVVEL